MANPILINIEDIPWQVSMLNNVTEEEVYEIIGSLPWFPETSHYFGIVCNDKRTPGVMEYNYFYTPEEALSFIFHQLDPSKRYFLIRQMTEEELQATLERMQYDRLLDPSQGHVQGE